MGPRQQNGVQFLQVKEIVLDGPVQSMITFRLCPLSLDGIDHLIVLDVSV